MTPSEAPANPIPQVLGRYQIESELGRGAMGVVYRARDPELERRVALKVVQVTSQLSEVDRGGYEKRFLAEARAAAALSHPAVIVVHDVGRDPASGTPYIAFEYLEGRTLADLLQPGRPLEWRRALRLSATLARALYHAHSRGIVHRDVKPANVMLLPSGEPKIMDFGIAKMRAMDLASAGVHFGTPLYMSPEQAAGEPLDGRSDLFSLGALLYRLLTGQDCFAAEDMAAVMRRLAQEDPPPPSHHVPGIPRPVDAIVTRLLAKHPAERYPDGGALADDLEDALEGRPLRSQPTPPASAPFATPLEALLEAEPPVPAGLDPPPVSQAAVMGLPSAPAKRLLALLVGGTAAVVLAAALWLSSGHERPAAPSAPQTTTSPTPRQVPPAAPAVAPAVLSFVLSHSLSRGRLRLWLDDSLVLDAPLAAQGAGRVRQVHALELPAGEYTLKVELRSNGDSWVGRARVQLAAGETRELEVHHSGLPGDRNAALVVLAPR